MTELAGFLTDGFDSRLNEIARDCGQRAWDSYGADGVTAGAVDVVRRLCHSLWIVPTVHGGLSIDMGSEAITIEIAADGRLGAVYVDGNDMVDWIERQRKAESRG